MGYPLILLQASNSYTPTSLIIAALTSVITIGGVFIKEEVEKHLSRKKQKREEDKKNGEIDKSLQHNNSIQNKIKEVLIQLQGYTECSRACLYAYHNGTKTHFGFSMNFVSMIEEKTDGIVAPLLDIFQNIPAGYYRTILDKVDKSPNGYAIIDTDNLDGDDLKMMERYQIAMSYDFKVGATVYEGVVSLVWVNKKHILSETEINHIKELVDQIYDLQKSIVKLPKI